MFAETWKTRRGSHAGIEGKSIPNRENNKLKALRLGGGSGGGNG